MIDTSLREVKDDCRHHKSMPSSPHSLLKKPGLDAEEPKNYRSVSNLTFVSKLVERVVSSWLVSYLITHGQMPQLQSAYRRHHSTEKTLLKVLSDVTLQSTVSK